MSKVLQRAMFKKPQHEHRSTGIASGLEYREEYAVGGRVGFQSGGVSFKDAIEDYAEKLTGEDYIRFIKLPLKKQIDEMKEAGVLRDDLNTGGRVGFQNGQLVLGGNSFTDAINKANLELIQSLQAEPVPQFDPIQVKTGLPSLGPLVGPDVVYPLSGGMATMRLNDAMAASSPENQPTTYDLMTPRVQRGIQAAPKGMTEAEAKKFTSNMGLKEEPKPDPDPAPGDQEKRIGNILDRLDSVDDRAKLKRESLNEELAALRAKQDKDNRLLAALNVVSAMNDPNLPQGASRIAAGAQQLGQEGALAIQTKQQRDDIDLARKFDIAEQEINREYALEDFRAQKQIEAEYGTEGVLVQNIRFFMKELGIDPGTPEARSLIESFISDNKKGSIDTLTNNVFEIANLDTTFPDQFRIKYGLPPKENLEDGSEAPLTFDEIKQAITNINDQILQAGLKDGGRVGFALGGEVTSNPNKNSVPIVMGYAQLKETLGEIVPDNVIKLISANPTAFKEFAAIETNQDVSDFNDKYEVRFTLPEPAMVREQQGDFATSITPPITAPSAVAANPQIMPMQTGAGQLTPTETAFLSPTEQAIKMRS